MASVKNQSCCECVAFNPEVRGKTPEDGAIIEQGECRMKAPIANVRPDVLVQWPIVPAEGWCLEFRPAGVLRTGERKSESDELPPIVEAHPGEVTGVAEPVVAEEPEKKKKKKKKGGE